MGEQAPAVNARSIWGGCALVFGSVILVYASVASHEFVNYDDPLWITDNPQVKAGLTLDGAQWAFTSFEDGNWVPLTWLSHMAVVKLFGLHAGAHALVNVFLHGFASVLLLVAFARITGQLWPSLLVALLFAVHPLHVESVAWVTERKDVLSGVFWMLAMLAYAHYAARPSVGRYALVAALLMGGLASKPMVVTLPCVFLLLDVWPLSRVGDWGSSGVGRKVSKLLVEKLPLFLLVAAVSAATVWTQREVGALGSVKSVPFGDRIVAGVASYGIYFWQTLWPFKLAVFYPPLGDGAATFWALAGASLLVGGMVSSVLFLRTRPEWTVGWLWYVGTLAPVAGFVSVGLQSHADRYMYIPSVGLFIVVAWSAKTLCVQRPAFRRGVVSVCVLVLIGLSLRTLDQTRHWRDSEALFAHALAVTERNFIAHGSYGMALLGQDDALRAADHFERAIAINPNLYGDHHNLGVANLTLGKPDRAKADFVAALELNQDHLRSRYLLGGILLGESDYDGAIDQYERLLTVDPEYWTARVDLGIAMASSGDRAAAAGHFARVLENRPDNVDALYNFALLRILEGETRTATNMLERVLEIEPGHAGAKDRLAMLYGRRQ